MNAPLESPAADLSAQEPADQPLVLRSSVRPGLVRLSLNRPASFNALSEAMLSALQSQFDQIANDRSVRVVILAAAGRAFCAGHDLKEMRSQPSEDYYKKLFGQCTDLMLSLQRLPQPVIAEVQGIATAAGCQLVSMCDLAVAADHARFAVSGVNLGLFCSTPGVGLSRNLLRKQAMEMLLTGDFISAPEALARGLINRVAPAAELTSVTEALAAKILSKPEAAIRLGKRLFYGQIEASIEDAYLKAGQTMACNMMDAEALEGVLAFIEKREPQWTTAHR
ncbi:MAG: enoyl-CoA hydratase [Betaproteobacteria bacterium]|nr:enoyl-CoA hydratase [Betaproteobacteria bacterium]